MTELLSLEETDNLIVQILSGRRMAYIRDSSDKNIPVLFKNPTSKDLLLSNHIYNVYYGKAKKEGFLTIEELKGVLKEKGIYTEEDEKRTKELVEQVDLAKKKRARFGNQKKFVEQMDKTITDLMVKLGEIEGKLMERMDMTCEHRASEEKLVFLAFRCSFDPYTEEPIWKTWDSFNEESDIVFRNDIIKEFSRFHTGLPTKTVRFIARSPLWRLRYIAATKTGADLFGAPVSDYSLDQLNLIYWSSYYLSLYEMMPDEIPPDDIIEDDDALDAYMGMLREERDAEIRERRQAKIGRFSKRGAFAHEEVIVTAHDPNYQLYDYTQVKKPETDKSSITEKALREKTRQKIRSRLRKG